MTGQPDTAPMLVDAHQHFWDPARGDYGWMPADDPVLSRVYAPGDLDAQRKAAGVGETVLVQAAPSVAETEYMLAIADATPWVAKVVGWIDFENPDHKSALEVFARHPKFAGVRPMIQDIADDDWMLREDLDWAFRAIIDLDLSFDCLGFPRHIGNFRTLLGRYPDMRAVLDHCLKPQLRDNDAAGFDKWARGMEQLATDTAAYCKLSGIVTEDDTMPGAEKLQPYSDHVLGIFGANRVMWGSDWPVLRLRCEYAHWHALAGELLAGLSGDDRARVMGGTAREFYRIET